MMKYFLLLPLLIFAACNNAPSGTQEPNGSSTSIHANKLLGPTFSEEAAYGYIEKQLSFGPRVPGTPAHKATAAYLQEELSKYTDTVYRQQTTVTIKDGKGTTVPCINLIGSINPNAKYRVLFLAHWDSRPWADMDANNPDEPILSADDGTSGVGVLLALAKAIAGQPLPSGVGIDILLTDVEDYAKSEWGADAYALGTQYWAKNPHVAGYTAQAGILLDMVGGSNPRFAIEQYSQRYAKEVVTAVWQAAEDAGHGDLFVYESGGGITDDHVPVNEIAKIPTIDIINMPVNSSTGFVPYWHTHQDNMDIIDKSTLKAVGQTLIQYLYGLKPVE